jgi:hypothetical protein
MNHRIARRIPALLLGALLAACGGDSGTNPDPGPGPSATTGSLALTVQGLPSGTTASIAVAGPGGYAHTAGATETLTELAPGAYSVTVTDVEVDGLVYGPAQSVVYTTVTAGSAAAVTVAYRGFDLSVDDFYITQSIQKYDGSIPLVAGRDGILRVFAKANNANNVKAAVRVRFYQGGILKSTSTIEAPSFAAPTEISEASLGTSWNLKVEGALIQPGLAIAVDIDPAGTIREADETDNQFPSSGAPKALDVKIVPRFDMVLVPVQQGDGSIGNVTEANKNDYVKDLLRMFPIAESHIRLRAPLVTTTTLKGSSTTGDDGSESWITLLGDVELQRVADGASGEYYFGVAKITHDFGIYGIANLSSKVGLGNDYFDGRDLNASMTLAHETGHSMGRAHVSCGFAIGDPDPAYPHANGQIGSFGMDVAAMKQFGPDTKDVMGYCADRWIGDYTYEQALNYRITTESSTGSGPPASVQPALIVSGKITNGALTLDPVFQVDTRPSLPRGGGAYRLEGVDASGSVVFSITFAGTEIDHASGTRLFTFAIPASMAQPDRLVALRVSGMGRQVVRRASGTAMARTGLSRVGLRTEEAAGGGTRLEWDAVNYPLVVLRDPETHEIISLVRGGSAALKLPSRPLEAIVSDGVHSANVGVITP